VPIHQFGISEESLLFFIAEFLKSLVSGKVLFNRQNAADFPKIVAAFGKRARICKQVFSNKRVGKDSDQQRQVGSFWAIGN